MDIIFKTATLSLNVKIPVRLIKLIFFKFDGDVISLYVLLNVHTLSQCDNSSTFKNIGGDVDKGDISVGYGYMNNRAYLQQNYLG